MKIIKAKRIKDMVVFGELDTERKASYKAGKLKEKDFFEWLKEKSRITDKLTIFIENTPESPLQEL